MKGLVAMSLALIGLQVLLTSSVGELVPAVSWVTSAVGKWIDPDVPLIADKAGAGTQGGKSSPKIGSAADSLGARAAGLELGVSHLAGL